METLTRETLQLNLDQFIGTENWYRHPLMPAMTYTDGVKYFAEHTQSYWLVDLFAIEYFPMLTMQPFLFITVESQRSGHCVIVVTNGNENQLRTKHVPFTNLIEGVWKFYLTDGVLLLPSEY